MSKRRSEYQNPAQNEENVTMLKFQKRAINLSEMPYVVLQKIFKNVHPHSSIKMMRASKPWNAFVTRNRRLWRKIRMNVNVSFDRLSDGRVAFTISLFHVSAKRQYIIKMEEAGSGTPITPDEDIFIQQRFTAHVADPMGQFLKIMKTLVEVVNIFHLDLKNMPDEATTALAEIFDKKTIIEDFFKYDLFCCPSTLLQFVQSLSGTKSIMLTLPSEAITADLFKLKQIQNADLLMIDRFPDYLPLGDADLLALKTRVVCIRSHSDITQRVFRTIVQEFMSFKRKIGEESNYIIYYQDIIAPEQVFDGFLYNVLHQDRVEKNIFKYEVRRSDNHKLVMESRGYKHYIAID